MKKLFIIITALLATVAQAAPSIQVEDIPNPNLAFTRPGPTFGFQLGLFYSDGYGAIVDNYATDGLLPTGLFGVAAMTRFSLGYNYNQNIAVEFAFTDNGVDFNEHHNLQYVSENTTQEYDFDVYNLESALILKNGFSGLNSEIHAKFGLAYTFGREIVSFHSSGGGVAPSWLNGQTQFQHEYGASGLAPLFGVGVAWSASQYLAYSFDYEHVFKPFLGQTDYNDPLQSTMQATNMWLLGILYHF